MRVVRVRESWMIIKSTSVFFGLIPWTTYLQFCDDEDVSRCSDLTFESELKAEQYLMDLVVRRCCSSELLQQ